MKKTITILIIALLLVSVVFIAGCKSSTPKTEPTKSIGSATENAPLEEDNTANGIDDVDVNPKDF